MEHLPVDHFVKAMQFTARTHRDVYTAIDPTQAALSQKDKVVIITGASQGIGAQGFVPSFAAAGPKAIVLVARSADKLQQVADGISQSHPDVETLVVPTDVSNPVSVAALFEKVKEKYGHADVLVNNAAVFSAIGPIKDVDQKSWWDEMVSISQPPFWHQVLIEVTDSEHSRHISCNATILEAAPISRNPSKDYHSHDRFGISSVPCSQCLRDVKTRSSRTHGICHS